MLDTPYNEWFFSNLTGDALNYWTSPGESTSEIPQSWAEAKVNDSEIL